MSQKKIGLQSTDCTNFRLYDEKDALLLQTHHLEKQLQGYIMYCALPPDTISSCLMEQEVNVSLINKQIRQSRRRIRLIREKYEMLVALAQKNLDFIQECQKSMLDCNSGGNNLEILTVLVEIRRLKNVSMSLMQFFKG